METTRTGSDANEAVERNQVMRLTREQKQFYGDNGYLAVENVLPPDLIEAEKQRLDWLCEHWQSPEAKRVNITHEPLVPAAQRGPQTVRVFNDLAEHEELFRRHALFAGLLDIVEDLIGAPLAIFDVQALLKPPKVGSEKPLHQDNAYFRVSPPEAVITCWCALDDATLENGCMRYVPGSHKLGEIGHRWIEGTTHQVPEGVDPSSAVPVPLKSGGIIAHHGLTVHCSGSNLSTRWRRPLVCHYVRSDADLSRIVRGSTRLIPAREAPNAIPA